MDELHQMMNIFLTIIGILPPYMENFKVFGPYFGINFGVLRFGESSDSRRFVKVRAGFVVTAPRAASACFLFVRCDVMFFSRAASRGARALR